MKLKFNIGYNFENSLIYRDVKENLYTSEESRVIEQVTESYSYDNAWAEFIRPYCGEQSGMTMASYIKL